jgi:hypothetical protein
MIPAQEKQKMLLATDTGHFSMIKYVKRRRLTEAMP